jgi:hypothetical protein
MPRPTGKPRRGRRSCTDSVIQWSSEPGARPVQPKPATVAVAPGPSFTDTLRRWAMAVDYERLLTLDAWELHEACEAVAAARAYRLGRPALGLSPARRRGSSFDQALRAIFGGYPRGDSRAQKFRSRPGRQSPASDRRWSGLRYYVQPRVFLTWCEKKGDPLPEYLRKWLHGERRERGEADTSKWLRNADVVKITHKPKSTISKACASGLLRTNGKTGRDLRIDPDSVTEYMAKHPTEDPFDID